MDTYELVARSVMFPRWILYLLSFSIVCLSVLNYKKEVISVHMRKILFSSSSLSSFTKEETSFFGKLNWILTLNYAITTAIATYMLLIYYEVDHIWLISIPFLYYLLQNLSIRFSGLISGEFKKIYENLLLSSFSAHAIGILLIPIILVWILNPQHSNTLIPILIFSFFAIHFLRIVRGVFSALRNKVAWYYIILYICTFEIWPVLIAYLLILPNFAE